MVEEYEGPPGHWCSRSDSSAPHCARGQIVGCPEAACAVEPPMVVAPTVASATLVPGSTSSSRTSVMDPTNRACTPSEGPAQTGSELTLLPAAM